jgi:hypothetical protein
MAMQFQVDVRGSTRIFMRHTVECALLTAGLCASSPATWSATAMPDFPKPGEGYQITQHDDPSSGNQTPAGYTGRTDSGTRTAVGNTPATAGKSYTLRFRLGNQIKTCPEADGTSEGKGVMSATLVVVDGPSRATWEMVTNATYRGQVGDDAWLQGPVNAEVDYRYGQSGAIRDSAGGAILSAAGTQVVQHITIPFGVSRSFSGLPTIGEISGGDPAQMHLDRAYGIGIGLTFWGAIFYADAQFQWRTGRCADIVFSPPSYTVQPAPGTDTKVKAEVKTKGGESVKANFYNAHADKGRVNPPVGSSDVRAPLEFTYTAPTQRTAYGGFSTSANSRAGVAGGEWKTGLGTDWSGQISCTRVLTGDEDHGELLEWSHSESNRFTIDVRDGRATARGYGEVHERGVNRQKALRGGAITLITNTSDTSEGTVDGVADATVDVQLDKASGRYSIAASMGSVIAGTRHTVSCYRDKCETRDSPMYVDDCLGGNLAGALTDPNRLRGSKNEVKLGAGRNGKGTVSWTVNWDLARRGSAQ